VTVGLAHDIFELTELCRIQTWWVAPERSPPAVGISTVDFRVRKATTILTRRLTQAPDLDAVAREAGLSRPHFYKLFREQTGVTPSIYLNTLRIEHALGFVADGEVSITSIADRLGFSCQSVFTRFFTSHVGMAPSQYRRVARILAA
jgi:AraC-like DNA-binding protein